MRLRDQRLLFCAWKQPGLTACLKIRKPTGLCIRRPLFPTLTCHGAKVPRQDELHPRRVKRTLLRCLAQTPTHLSQALWARGSKPNLRQTHLIELPLPPAKGVVLELAAPKQRVSPHK